METRVGWVLSGPMEDPNLFVNFASLESNHTLYVDNYDNRLIQLELNKFWNLESLGITSEKSSSVHQKFCNTITFNDGRYQVKLPWKNEHSELCDNFELSKNRLTRPLKPLRHTPKLLQEYDSIINEQVCNKIVESIKLSELKIQG